MLLSLCIACQDMQLCCWVQVQGSKAPTGAYLVFPSHYCSCEAFFFDVISKGEATSVSAAAGLVRKGAVMDSEGSEG